MLQGIQIPDLYPDLALRLIESGTNFDDLDDMNPTLSELINSKNLESGFSLIIQIQDHSVSFYVIKSVLVFLLVCASFGLNPDILSCSIIIR